MNWCFQVVVLEKTLQSPLDCKEIKPGNLKEMSPEYSLEGLMLKLELQYFSLLILRADSLDKTLMLGKIEGRRRRGRQRMRWLDSVTKLMDMNLSKLWEMVKDREAWHPAVHGVTKSRTWLSNWTTTRVKYKFFPNSWATQVQERASEGHVKKKNQQWKLKELSRHISCWNHR